jgi:hypothetical protein
LRISEPKDKIPAALSFFEADKTIASTAIRYKTKQKELYQSVNIKSYFL